MKQSPQEQSALARLQASKFSGEGFLGTDPRALEEIIAADRATLARRGVAIEQVVEALTGAFERGRAALGAPVEVAPGVTAVHHESMGRIPSPFRGDGVFEKGEVVLTRAGTDATLVLTALGLALIARHAFFQGRGGRYRLEPEQLIAWFGLAP